MHIAVAVSDNQVAVHFGHCDVFRVFHIIPDTSELDEIQEFTPPPHEPGRLPLWLKQIGASVVISGGMGQRAQELCRQHHIEPICGVSQKDPEEAVRAFLAGNITGGENLCDH